MTAITFEPVEVSSVSHLMLLCSLTFGAYMARTTEARDFACAQL
jgi:hypothetical protein